MPLLTKSAAVSAATILLASFQALAGLSILSPLGPSARAAEPMAFAIPAEDGYGIAECMRPGSACGQAMANSWCEAHGHRRAVAFGPDDDVTGVIAPASATASTAGELLIRCSD